MSDQEAVASLAVSLVCMPPFMLLSALAIRHSGNMPTYRRLRIRIAAGTLLLMGVVMILWSVFQVLSTLPR